VSRKVYETVDERCAACVMYGGPEEPCLPPKVLELIRKKHPGQECPRVDLLAENRGAANVLTYLTDVDLKPLAAHMFEAVAGDLDEDGRFDLMARLAAALHDPEVAAILHPRPQPQPRERERPAPRRR
jgi:hypothetical protein